MSLEHLNILSIMVSFIVQFQVVQCAALWGCFPVQISFCPHRDHCIFRTGIRNSHFSSNSNWWEELFLVLHRSMPTTTPDKGQHPQATQICEAAVWP